MKRESQKKFITAAGLLTAFVLWTIAIRIVDVQAIGPMESAVGFATVNCFFHNLTGVHLSLYMVTDWLSLIPLGTVLGFALLGLVQWIQRKHLCQVDHSILVLGGFYAVVMAVYVFFETVAVNYRPVLIDGILEASYPSSTTILVLCVMPTAMMQLNTRIQNNKLRRWTSFAIIIFTATSI